MARDDLGKQGSRPGQTFQAQREKARAGSLAGKQYASDSYLAGQRGGGDIRNAGQGTSVVKKRGLSPEAEKRTGNDPWERPSYQKPGAF